jgi:hypothetical protein
MQSTSMAMRSPLLRQRGTETKDAVEQLTRAYAPIAVLTGVRLRPRWLPIPDAAQEAILVLRRLIENGSTTIAAGLPLAIGESFAELTEPDNP